ncbi:hypothetical protein [Streptomyces shaanxiensis]|uniref:ABC transporter permease n=1 Tax=Streptomyces shaanxiensis TaxID=653357 RepID=A0ABP7UJG4_9ACTN
MTTALTAATTPAGRTTRGPSGLVWAVLRVHRTALVFWGLVLAAMTACLIWMYAIGDEARRGMGGCVEPVAAGGLPSCSSIDVAATDTYSFFIGLLATSLSFVIFPVAAWAGGALVGHELESGTARLAWTQSVTPARWLAAKLAVPAVLLAAGTCGVALLNLWARQDGGPGPGGNWYYSDVFIVTGPTVVAYPLAGLALGALTGLLLRRALPAAGVGFAAALVLYKVLERYRADLWPTVTRAEAGGFELPRSAWQLSWDGPTRATRAIYHPQSHFWPLQYVETGILLTVAAAATLAAFALLRRRTP